MTETTATTLYFANFLSPLLQDAYLYIARFLGTQVGKTTKFHTGTTLDEFSHGWTHIAFLCGLQYIRLRQQAAEIELLAAPVLRGLRYQNRPIYFSDVVVRRDRPYCSFADLRDKVWAYNEVGSHSGYNVVGYSMLQRHFSPDYFRSMQPSGSHWQSLQMVIEGQADATALDSHVFDIILRRNQRIAAQVRWIDVFGPSSVPPLVISTRLDPQLRQELRNALLTMHQHPSSAEILHEAGIERFVAVRDEQYNDIRLMDERVHTSAFAQAPVSLASSINI